MLGKLSKPILTALLVGLSINTYAPDAASAGSATNRKIVELSVYRYGANHAIVTVDGSSVTGRPTCHQTNWDRSFIIDVSTNKGKAMFSLLTSAFLAGKTVHLYGADSCTTVNTDVIETLNYVRMV